MTDVRANTTGAAGDVREWTPKMAVVRKTVAELKMLVGDMACNGDGPEK